jgi:hypothetical protein
MEIKYNRVYGKKPYNLKELDLSDHGRCSPEFYYRKIRKMREREIHSTYILISDETTSHLCAAMSRSEHTKAFLKHAGQAKEGSNAKC